MEYYIEAIRHAVCASSPRDLKPALDFLVERAREDYKSGALDVAEYGDIVSEYSDALTAANAINYL